MTKAYFIGKITITDPDQYASYAQQVPATIQEHGGKYIVRGGDPKQMEGDVQGSRIVVLEFANRDAALGWYNSPLYQAILPIRLANSKGNLVLVDGIGITA